MRSYKKNLLIVLLVVLGLLTSTASAFGASKLKDDIKLSVTTDKTAYEKGEKVKLTISLNNNSDDTTIEDITIRPIIPEALKDILVGDVKEFKIGKLEPQSSKVMETISFSPAEEKEVAEESEPKEEEKKGTLPATGEESNKIIYLGLALILLGVLIFFGIRYGKKFNGILSMFIVGFLILGLFPLAALADTEDDYITVEGSTSITIDGEEYTISATATFKVVEEEEEPEPEIGKVTIRYVDEEGKEIADSETLSGEIGEKWNSEAKKIEDYEWKEIKDNKDKHGLFTKEEQEVVHVYRKVFFNLSFDITEVVDGILVTSEDPTIVVRDDWDENAKKIISKDDGTYKLRVGARNNYIITKDDFTGVIGPIWDSEDTVVKLTLVKLNPPEDGYYAPGDTLEFTIERLEPNKDLRVGMPIHMGGPPWACDEPILDSDNMKEVVEEGETVRYWFGKTNAKGVLNVSGEVGLDLPYGVLHITLPEYGYNIDNSFALPLQVGGSISIEGEPNYEKTLSVKLEPSYAISLFEYQWQWAETKDGEYEDIYDAVKEEYTVTEDDLDLWIRVKATANPPGESDEDNWGIIYSEPVEIVEQPENQ